MMKKTLLTLVCTFVALCASTQNTFQLKTSGTDPQLLVVQYSGEDKPEKGKKFLFNISVNGTLLYTEGLNRNRHGLFEIQKHCYFHVFLQGEVTMPIYGIDQVIK